VVFRASHEWTDYAYQILGELVGKGSNIAHIRP